MDKINVVFGLDQKYILPAFVTMHSILKKSKSIFDFFILTTDDIEKDFLELQSSLRKIYINFDIHVIKISEDYFKTVKINWNHISRASFNRLLIAEIIKDIDKCIYLDCDLLLNCDLALLYSYNLKNNYIAGVKDCHLIGKSSYEEEHRKHLGIPSCEKYINAGVLVMNLKKIRDDHMTEQFIKQAYKDNMYEDQDVLNFCCYGNIGILPLKWNLFHFYLGDSMKFINNLAFDKSEMEFNWNKPYILHMGAEYKPWNSKRFKGALQWWKYAEIYKENRWYSFYENKANGLIHTDLKFFLEQLKKFSGIKVIWGYSKNAMQLYDILINENIQDCVCFVDNNDLNEGKVYRGLNVCHAKKLFSELDNLKEIGWIISCQTNRSFQEVKKQILEAGVPESHIFRSNYNIKSINYYLALDERYYCEEVDEIFKCEFFNDDFICTQKEKSKWIKTEIVKMQKFQEIREKYKMDYWLLKDSF